MILKIIKFSYVILFLVVPGISFPVFSQEGDEKKITLLFIGDIMGHDTQIASAENKETNTYDYEAVFRYIKPVLSEADVAIANLEVTLAGPPYKGYPQFSSPAALAVSAANAGIDYLVLANNHSADRGNKGIISTINKLDSLGIPHTGTFLSQEARDTLSPLIINRNGFSLALLNYTYGTNGIRVPKPVIVDSLGKDVMINDIARAKKKNPDAVILFLHWGTEYDTLPGKDQVALAGQLLAEGADLVIGSHPHVLQKMDRTKNKEKDGIIVYSLGNFVSNQRKPKTDGGSLVRIELTKNADRLSISEAGYYLTWVHTPVENQKLRFYILPCSEYEKKPDFFSGDTAYNQMMRFIRDSRKLLQSNNGMNEYIYDGTGWSLDN